MVEFNNRLASPVTLQWNVPQCDFKYSESLVGYHRLPTFSDRINCTQNSLCLDNVTLSSVLNQNKSANMTHLFLMPI